MIKIFRKVRRKLLSKNEFGKYLTYAIGEIILVVIGILIALQINNWNQREQMKKEELKTLVSLKESIRMNIAEFDYIYKAQVVRNESLQKAIFNNISNKPIGYLDSLINTNVRNYTFDPSTGIYSSIINSGKIELITNDSLKNRISRLYDRVSDYQESEDEITEYTRDHLEVYFIDNYIIDPAVLAGLKKRSEEEEQRDKAFYVKTFSSPKVNNMYVLLLNKMSDVMIKGKELQSEYATLVSELDDEIESKK
ncbi:DUF6090 family protein [Roseivirga sp. BDSF3-8]|uniref:DUF6090 family protein n=1 Tax=Roseivirga sp. BDSF3-8 TaxID=3241598 RepID=UPI0035326E60